MNWFWLWLVYGIPWWLQVALIALAVGVPLLLLAIRVFGWQRVKPWVLPLAALLGAFALARKNRQEGYQDREVQEQIGADQVRDEFNEIHDRNEALTEDELDKKNDPWLDRGNRH